MTGNSGLLSSNENHLTQICGLLVTVYLVGVTLSPSLEKVGQIGLLLWSLGYLFTMPWRRFPLTVWDKVLMSTFAAFFAVAVLSYWINGGGYEGGKMLGRYAKFLLVVPLFFLFRRFGSQSWLIAALLLAVILNGIWGILEFHKIVQVEVGGRNFPSVNATVNPIQYGNIVLSLTVMMLACIGVYQQQGRVWQATFWLAVWLGFFITYASGARGAIIAMPLLAVFGLYIAWKNKKAGLNILVVFMLAVLAALPVTDRLSKRTTKGLMEYKEHHAQIEKEKSSVGTRLHMWRASWLIFQDSPVIGVGPGNYEARAGELYEQGKVRKPAVYNHPHSEYFSVLATRGLIGLASLGAMFLVPLLYFWRFIAAEDLTTRAIACAGVMLVLEIGQGALTESLFRLSSTMGFYIMCIALTGAILSRIQDNHVSE